MRIQNQLLLFLFVILAGCEGNHQSGETMIAKDLVGRYVGVWNGDSLSVLDSLLTPDYVRHTSVTSGPAHSPEELRKVITHMRVDMPDLTIHVDDIVVSGSTVVFRWTSEGTDSGPGDFPPTNKHFKTTGLTWLRLEKDRIAEEWSGTDQLEALLQLGFKVVPPEAGG